MVFITQCSEIKWIFHHVNTEGALIIRRGLTIMVRVHSQVQCTETFTSQGFFDIPLI